MYKNLKFLVLLSLFCAKSVNAMNQQALDKALIYAIKDTSDNKALKEKVQSLLKQGANANAQVYYGSRSTLPALELAIAFNRSIEILNILLDHRADPNYGEDLPPIFEAISKGNLPVVKLLIERGAKIDENTCIVTPLIWAAQKAKDDIVAYLLNIGANADVKDKNGAGYKEYRLSYAAENNELEKAREMLLAGANPNIATYGNVVPLRYAFMQNNFDMIKLLLDFGADPYIPFDSYGDRKVIDLVENAEQRKFVENYYIKQRREAVSAVLNPIMPKDLVGLINSYI